MLDLRKLWTKLSTIIQSDSASAIALPPPAPPGTPLHPYVCEYPYTLTIRFDDISFGPQAFYRLVRANAAALNVEHEVELEEHERERVTLEYLCETYELCGEMEEKVRFKFVRTNFTGGVAPARLANLRIEGGAGLLQKADAWVRLVADQPSFLRVFLLDTEFDYWQNVTSPSTYSLYGRSIKGLTLKSNGLPLHFREDEVDTSNHPGRIPRYIRGRMFEEVVAYRMWFGDKFWPLVGKTPESIAQDARLNEVATIEQFSAKIVKLTVGATPFNDQTPPQILDQLRAAVYGDAPQNEPK